MFNILLATIGIMSALPEEGDSILHAMTEKTVEYVGKRQFVKGSFEGVPVVFCIAGIGKVSAATTAALLIERFDVDEIVFTGVAGGGHKTDIGDVVIGSSYVQHDLDTRPIYPYFYITSLATQIIEADSVRVLRMKNAAQRFLSTGIQFPDMGVVAPKVHVGMIASGDQFIGSLEQHSDVSELLREILSHDFYAIEMEGASVAQVCTELQVPFIVLRTISDRADHKASVNFLTFIEEVARQYSLGILKEYFRSES
jgi:adenosylhomocysteine nucleosidase